MRSKPYLWEESAFDSEILGVAAAKIIDIKGDTPKKVTANVSALIQELTTSGIRYAVYRVPASDYVIIQCLEKKGFLMIDGLITLQTPVSKDHSFHAESIVEASKKDLPQLSRLAGTVFRGGSRYYHDPYIKEKTADAVYRKWIKNSIDGSAADVVLVWKERGKILGFVTAKKKGKTGDVPLIGVSSAARGNGIGKKLMQAALSVCKQWGMSEVTVATQVTNIPALRLYQSCGFTIAASHFTLRWLREKRAR